MTISSLYITNWQYACIGTVSFFKQSVQGVLVLHFIKSFVEKHFLGIRLIKAAISHEMFKEKVFTRSSCLKDFARVKTQVFLICIYFDSDTGRSLLSVCLIIFLQDHLFISNFSGKHKLYLLELGLYDL